MEYIAPFNCENSVILNSLFIIVLLSFGCTILFMPLLHLVLLRLIAFFFSFLWIEPCMGPDFDGCFYTCQCWKYNCEHTWMLLIHNYITYLWIISVFQQRRQVRNAECSGMLIVVFKKMIASNTTRCYHVFPFCFYWVYLTFQNNIKKYHWLLNTCLFIIPSLMQNLQKLCWSDFCSYGLSVCFYMGIFYPFIWFWSGK